MGEQTDSSFELQESLFAVRNGNEAVLAKLLEHYRPYLMLLARLRPSPHLQAKYDDSDLVQETMVMVHRDAREFRGTTEAELTAWLRRIMATISGKHVRRYARQRRDAGIEQNLEQAFSQSSEMLGDAFAAPESSPSQKAIRRENAVILSRALAQLSSDYREALILYKLEGLTLAQTADRMGRSTDSVQKLIARGLLDLRRKLEAAP